MIRRFVPARVKRFLKRLLNGWRMLRLRRLDIGATTYDIVCFPIIDWRFRWQRPQQLLSQFAKEGHRVFIVRAGEVEGVTLLRDNVFELTFAATVDVYSGELHPDVVTSLLETLDAWRRRFDIVCAISLVQVSTWRDAVLEARRRFGWKVVYDCMDEWSEFPGMKPRVLEAERRLVEEADLVTVSSRRLQEKWPRALLVRNAADFEHFANGGGEAGVSVPRPAIGYFGAIASWFDAALLARVAAERPHHSFVLIGEVFDVEIPALPNVHLLGPRPYAAMPSYLRDFDVCMIPFVVSDITAATDPVKFYEYLSQGKPVVSTPMPELEPYRDLL